MREVSSRASAILLEVLADVGIDLERLVEGLPVTLADLRDTSKRIDWNVFATLTDRIEVATAGIITLEEIGEHMLRVPSFDFPRRAGRLFVTPHQLYTAATRLFAPALFPHLTLRIESAPAGRLLIRGELASGYRGSSAFFRVCHGNAVALPRLLGLPPSKIEEQRITPTASRLTILPPRSHTIGTRIGRGARALSALGDAYRGMARQQEELEASVEALHSTRHEFRQLLERLPEGVLIHRDGVVRWANAAMIALLGHSTLDDVIGTKIVDYLPAEERAAVLDRLAKASRNIVNEERVEYRVVRPDGTDRRVQASATQHVEFEGASARLVVMRDMTDHHRLQEQLALADRMASIGTVAAGVAHEINNPLAYVHTSLEVAARELHELGDSPHVSKLRECITWALEGTERVRGIVRNLKTLSRAEGDALEAVDATAVLESTLVLAANALNAKARVVKHYARVPLARATEGRLGQVFLNVLLNAADALPDGDSSRQTIRVSVDVNDEGRVVVEITDSGTGIPKEIAARVFDPFFTTKAVGAGTGLGLAICHRLITQMGGEITFTSSPSGGTTFRIVLLAVPAEAAKSAIVERSRVSDSRGRVLVVDDEPALLQSLCLLLGDAHEVVAAPSVRDAIAILREDVAFDVVLADLMMADLTGMDLYESVRTTHPGLERRIVFMTGGVFGAPAREFIAQVPNRCIEKPFTNDTILRALGDLIVPAAPPALIGREG